MKIYIFLIFTILFLNLAGAITIDYVDPTPPDGSNTYSYRQQITTEIVSNGYDIVSVDLDGNSFYAYDDSLVLMMNFDNRSAFNEDYKSDNGYVGLNISDMSKYGNNGTITLGMKNYTEGHNGGAFQYNGTFTASRIEIPWDISLNYSSATYSAWIKMNGEGVQSGSFICKDTIGLYLSTCLSMANNVISFKDSLYTYASYNVSDIIYDGEWHHILAGYNDATDLGFLFIDGELLNYGTNTNGFSYSIYPTIIGSAGLQKPINGSMDSVRIWNKALTSNQAEIVYRYELNFFNQTHSTLYYDAENLSIGEHEHETGIRDDSSTVLFESSSYFITIPSIIFNIFDPIGYFKDLTRNAFTKIESNITCNDSACGPVEVFLYKQWNETFTYLPNGTHTNVYNFSSTFITNNDYLLNSTDEQIISVDDSNFLSFSREGKTIASHLFITDLDQNKEDVNEINITSKGYSLRTTGGCAFAYSYDGVRYTPEFAIGDLSPHKLWEMPSFGMLPSIKKIDNKYHLAIKEIVPETQYIDNLELWKIEHDVGTKVLPEQLTGEIHTISEEELAISSTDSLGNTYQEQLENEDNKFFVSNMTDFNFESPPDWDYLDLKFNNSESENRTVKFILRAKDGGLIHSVWENVVSGSGGYETLNTDMEFFANLTEWVQNDAMIHVYQKIGGKFVRINSLNFGATTFYHTYAFDFEEIEGEDIEIRLMFIPYSFQIDQAYIDRTPNEDYTLKVLNPTLNDSNIEVNMSKLLIQDSNYFQMELGDYVKFDFIDIPKIIDIKKGIEIEPVEKIETIMVYSNAYSESYLPTNPSVITEKNMPLLRELAINNTLSRYMFIEPFYNKGILSTSMVSVNTIPFSTDYYANGDMNVQTEEGIKQLKDIKAGDGVESFLTSIMHKTTTSVNLMRKSNQTNFEYYISTDNGNSINTTGSQVFFNGEVWVSAEHLQLGDYLFDGTDKTKITSISKEIKTKEYYSVSVFNSVYLLNDYVVHNVATYSLLALDITEGFFGTTWRLLDFHELASKETVSGLINNNLSGTADLVNVSKYLNESGSIKYLINSQVGTSSTDTVYLFDYYTILTSTNNRTLVPSGSGSHFWVNESNPQIVNVGENETEDVTWNVYSTGDVGDSELQVIEYQLTNRPDTLNYTKIYNVTIIAGESGDTCVYSGPGMWIIDCSENCAVDDNYEVVDGNLTFNNVGNISIDGNITFTSDGYEVIIDDGCMIDIGEGGGFI